MPDSPQSETIERRAVKKYRFLDHTGDEAVEIYGGSMAELFQNAAEAFTEVLTDSSAVQPVETRAVELVAAGEDELLIAWLNELLYLFEIELFLPGHCDIGDIDGFHLKGVVWGEKHDQERHPIRRVIKAVTYHQASVSEENGCWKGRVVFDL